MMQRLIEVFMLLVLYVSATYGIMTFHRTLFYRTERDDGIIEKYSNIAIAGMVLVLMIFTVPLFSLS